MAEYELADLDVLINAEGRGRHIPPDLRDVTPVCGEAVALLARCEADGIALEQCPAYVREWIRQTTRQALERI